MANKVGSVEFDVNINAENAKKQLDEASKSVENFGKQAEKVDATASSAGKTIDSKMIAKASMLGNLYAEAAKKVGSAMVKIGQSVIDAGRTFENGRDIIVKATGATGDSLKELEDVAREVFAEQGDFDYEQIASGIGEVNTRLGYTGETLKTTTALFASFADATGQDVKESVASVTQVMNAWGIEAEKLPDLLDDLTTAGQTSGISVDKLEQSLTQSAGTLKSFGFSVEESVSLMMSLEKSGTDTNQVLMGMKKVFGDAAAGGKNAREEWDKLVDTLTNGKDVTAANELAVKTFGERVGVDLVSKLRSGQISFEEFNEVIKNNTGILESTDQASETTAEKIQKLKNQLTAAAGEIYDQLAPYITQYMPDIINGVKNLIEASKPFIENIGPQVAIALAGAAKVAKVLADTLGWVADKMNMLSRTGKYAVTDLQVMHEVCEDNNLSLEKMVKNLAEAADINGWTAEKVREYADATFYSSGATKEASQAALQAAAQGVDLGKVLAELVQDYREQAEATQDAADAMDDLTDSEAKADGNTQNLTQDTQRLTEATEEQTEAVDELIKKQQEAQEAQKKAHDEALQYSNELRDTQVKNTQDSFDTRMMKLEEEKANLATAKEEGLISEQEYQDALQVMHDEYDIITAEKEEIAKTRRIEQAQALLSTTQEVMNGITGILQNVFQTEANLLEQNHNDKLAKLEQEKEATLNAEQAEYDALKKKLDDGQMSEEEYTKALEELKAKHTAKTTEIDEKYAKDKEEIDKDYARERDKIGKKAFEANKATQIANAAINAAQAIIQCFAQLGPIAGGIMATIVAGTTAGEIIAITSQQYTSGSYAVGSPNITQDQIAQVHRGETILRPADAERFREAGGMYGVEQALSEPMTSGGVLNTFNLNNQMTGVIEVDGVQLGIAVLKNLDQAKQFVY